MIIYGRHVSKLRIVATSTLCVAVLAGCAGATIDGSPHPIGRTSASGATPAPSSSAPTTSAAPKLKSSPVHVSVNMSDGATFGVGMPYIAMFDQRITDGAAFAEATKVTVDGDPVDARWYFEDSDPASGHVMEAHLRMQHYWPAHAQIHVDLPVKGISGGQVKGRLNTQYVFENSITSDWATGAEHIVTVSNASHSLTVTNDGTTWGTFPVSLGASDPTMRTLRGIKVIMEKGVDIPMRGPGYYDAHVKFTQRLTYGGEYLHAAPWNCVGAPGCVGPANNIGHSNSSNGCTNLRPAFFR